MNYSWSKTEHILRWSLDGMKGFGYFSYIFAEIVNLFVHFLFCETLLVFQHSNRFLCIPQSSLTTLQETGVLPRSDFYK